MQRHYRTPTQYRAPANFRVHYKRRGRSVNKIRPISGGIEEDSEKCREYWGERSDDHDGKFRHIDSMVDNGGSKEAGTEHAVPLAAFLNPKMHKAFPPREVLISKE